MTIPPFAGLRANATLGDALTHEGVVVSSRDNLSISFAMGFDLDVFRLAVNRLSPRAAQLMPTSLPLEVLASMKFSWCLEPQVALASLRARLTDPEAVRSVLEETVEIVSER